MGYDKYNIEEDKTIDKNNLHEEWLRQSVIVENYTTLEAELELRKDQLKANLDLKRAELDRDIRTSPSQYGLKDKPTDVAIDRAIIRDEEFNSCLHEYLQAKYDYNIVKGYVKTIADSKKSALEHLAWLWAKNYFSTTSSHIPPDDVIEVTRRLAADDYRRRRPVE